MSYIKDQPWYTSRMDAGDMMGECANCHKVCREHSAIIDDCYAVYRGRCPYCNALNLLDNEKGRGYSGTGMHLVLPTDHEIRMNDWETDVPTRKCDCPKCRKEVVA